MTAKLPIPADALSQHIIVLGKTRSGKSSKVRVVVEWLLEHKKRVVILTPKDDWWGLKASADGKSEGYPIVIFGGKHEDLPFNPRAGAQVAELISTGNRPCLITFFRQKPSDRTRFYNDFMEGLFKFHQGELYVVIDEVHNFAPKGKVFTPDAGMMIHWSNTLASEGQGQGLIMIAASQRPQKVHNDLLTSCETLIACRVIHKADRDANKDWIDGCADPQVGRDLLADLASMDRGDAWVWSPEIGFGPKRISWPMFATFDSFKPNTGSSPAKLKGWADVDLDEVKVKLAKVVEEARANDPVELRKQIAELQRQIKAAPAAASDPRELDAANNRGFKAGFAEGQAEAVRANEVGFSEGWKKCAGDVRRHLVALVDKNDAVVTGLESAVAVLANPPSIVKTDRSEHYAPAKVPHSAAPKPGLNPVNTRLQPAAKVPHNGDARVSRPQQVIIDQLAVLKDRDIYPASRATLAAFCKVSPSSSGYEKNLSTLKTMGMLDYPQQGVVALTQEGQACAAAPFDDGTPPADFWLAIVNEPKQKILRVLIDEHPTAMSRGAIAQKASVSESSSGFEKNLSQLKTLGAIDYPMSGVVALTRHVMP